LSELINATIIKTINIKNMTSSADNKEIEPVSNKCTFCGEISDVSWTFCKKCGKEL